MTSVHTNGAAACMPWSRRGRAEAGAVRLAADANSGVCAYPQSCAALSLLHTADLQYSAGICFANFLYQTRKDVKRCEMWKDVRFGETFHFKTVVRTGVLGINYWIEVRMEREEEHLGRQMEANTQSGSLKHYSGKMYQRWHRFVPCASTTLQVWTFCSHQIYMTLYYNPGQKKRPLRLCIKSEHCKSSLIARRCAAMREVAASCATVPISWSCRYCVIRTVFWFYA